VRAGVDAWTAGDYDAAVKAWQSPAANGDADALFNMGQAYKLGRGVPKDLGKAEAMYGKAARLGHVRAADNFGILLFQTGRQPAAIPWLEAAADRGEPRAMYVLGIAAYNGDFAPKDWVRAYALMTRAAGSGLAQAMTSLTAMNEAIPLAQRQMGISLAGELEQRAADARTRELAAADLGTTQGRGLAPLRPAAPASSPPPPPSAARTQPSSIQKIDLPPSGTSSASPEMAEGEAAARGAEDAPAPPARAATPKSPAPKLAAAKPPAPKPVVPRPTPSTPATDSGTWRIQLGAFAVKANADALWNRVRGRAELAGHPRIDLGSGITRLLAGGFSQAGAMRACAALKAAGFTCLVTNS
jgi:cell division protein FtsN